MRKIKSFFLWLWLLTKRLYKKPTFLAILVLIPLLVLGYGMVAREDSGVMTIALASYENDPLSMEIINDLSDSQVLRFLPCDTPEKARQLVNTGKADGAWIFLDDLENRICKFVDKPMRKYAFVEIIERETTVITQLTREKLTGTVFSHISPYVYLHYIREEIPQLDHVSDKELTTYYHETIVNSQLFEYAFADGTDGSDLLEEGNFLVAPVRGMLAVVVALCGLAGAMYAMRDEQRGTYGWLAEKKRPLITFAGLIVCVANVAIAMVIALWLFGVTVHWLREVLVLLGYILCIASFSMLMRRLCGNIQVLAMVTPILVVVMLIICPVFFDLGDLLEFQLLFPPTYYINAIFSDRFFVYMFLYTGICLFLSYLLGKLKENTN